MGQLFWCRVSPGRVIQLLLHGWIQENDITIAYMQTNITTRRRTSEGLRGMDSCSVNVVDAAANSKLGFFVWKCLDAKI